MLHVTDTWTFTLPSGEPLRARDLQAWWERDGVWIVDLGLRFELTPLDWSRVDLAAAFHLVPEARGETFGGEFDDDKPIRLDIRLERVLTQALRPQTADLVAFADRLRGAGPEDPLRRTGSWRALRVTQDMPVGRGRLRRGFRTAWDPATHA